MLAQYKIILCSILNPVNDTECLFYKKGALALKLEKKSKDYKIEAIGEEDEILHKYRNQKSKIVTEYLGKVMMPTFFDNHFHWVQDDVREMPKDNLLEWLANYTWPYESKFKQKSYATMKAKEFAKKLLANGTLGGAVYASIHGHSVHEAHKNFIGDFAVGNVLMDMNSPEYLIQTPKNAISQVAGLSKKYKQKYAMTPRFAITTSPDVMKKCAAIARKNNSFIQTHLDETKNEIDFVLSIYKSIKGFEKVKTYTEIYKKCNILGPKTIMGHCIHLEESEIKMLKQSKTAIAHCPTSNAPVKELGLGSGLFDFKRVEKAKIKWSLASDIGGGPYLSMFDVMRSFVAQNKQKKIKEATFVKALYRSTLAGAEVLKLEKECGNFKKGKWANFILVDAPKKSAKSAEEMLSAIIRPYENKREKYQTLVSNTFFRGVERFTRDA